MNTDLPIYPFDFVFVHIFIVFINLELKPLGPRLMEEPPLPYSRGGPQFTTQSGQSEPDLFLWSGHG